MLPSAHFSGTDLLSYEKDVILSPVKPKPAVHAGIMQLTTLTTTIIAKQSQNDKPIAPPIDPTFSVATAMFALNLIVLVFPSVERQV